MGKRRRNHLKLVHSQKKQPKGRKVASITLPQPYDPNIFLGRTLIVPNDYGIEQLITVERVLGNVKHQHKYEINGTFLIDMLDFHTQMEELRRPTKDEWDQWNLIIENISVKEK